MTASEIAHLRELMDERFAALDRALLLQAAEYERRLEMLNHENARVSQAAERSVSLEKFEGFVKAQSLANEQFAEFIATARATADTAVKTAGQLRSTVLVWITIATFGLGITTVIFRLVGL